MPDRLRDFRKPTKREIPRRIGLPIGESKQFFNKLLIGSWASIQRKSLSAEIDADLQFRGPPRYANEIVQSPNRLGLSHTVLSTEKFC